MRIFLFLFISFMVLNAQVFKIGVLPYTNSVKIIQLYQPLKEFLSKELNQEVEIYTSKDYKTFYNDVENNDFDLVITGPHFGVLHLKNGFKLLFRYDTSLKPIFIVLNNSKYKELSDLKNTKIVMSNKLSVSSMGGIKALKDIGFKENIDYSLFESKSHTSAIKSVLLNEYDSAITTYTPIKQLLDNDLKNKIRIIESKFEMPHLFLITNPNTKNEDFNNLKKLLMNFSNTEIGKEFFKKSGYVGYTDISKKDIEEMTILMEDTKKFLFNE